MPVTSLLAAYKHYLSPVPTDLTPTAIPVSDNPARAKGVDLRRKTAREVSGWVR